MHSFHLGRWKSGDCYTTLGMYVMPLTYILKIVKIINLMLCLFHHKKKRNPLQFACFTFSSVLGTCTKESKSY